MLIPFPLDGIDHYEHLQVKELNSGAVLTSFIFSLQKNLQAKLKLL